MEGILQHSILDNDTNLGQGSSEFKAYHQIQIRLRKHRMSRPRLIQAETSTLRSRFDVDSQFIIH